MRRKERRMQTLWGWDHFLKCPACGGQNHEKCTGRDFDDRTLQEFKSPMTKNHIFGCITVTRWSGVKIILIWRKNIYRMIGGIGVDVNPGKGAAREFCNPSRPAATAANTPAVSPRF